MVTTSITLMERLRDQHDSEAWQHFVAIYTPLVMHWVRKSGVVADEANDLVQDVFVILLRELPKFQYDPDGSFGAWLRTITMNRCRDAFRRKHNDRPISLEVEPELPIDADDFCETEYRAFIARRALALMQAEFEPSTWRACWETVVEGRSSCEVAAELSLSLNAVYVARGRVLRRLREELSGLLE